MSRTITTKYMAAVGTGVALVALSAVATPFPPFFNAFMSMYSGSMSGDNANAASSCYVCHTPNGNDTWNDYGWDLRTSIQGGADINAAMLAVESLDSDADPTGSTNIEEINASTQPGWTAGPNNTIHSDDGSTSMGQTAPAGIAGDLDPSGGFGTSYCSSTPNSSGGAALLTGAGSTVALDQDLILTTMPVPNDVFGIHYYGPNQISQAFGNAFRCVGGATQRLPISQASGDTHTTVVAFGTPQAAGIVAGTTLNFQGWFRDSGDTFGFQLSDGLSIVFQ